MMSFTHISVGIAASVVAMQPKNTHEWLISLAGGAVGGIIPDIDVKINKYSKDALYGREATIAIVAVVIAVDVIAHTGIVTYLLNHVGLKLLIGLATFVILCVIGTRTSHRTFSHSLLALISISVSLYYVYPYFVLPFAIGFVTHILLDLLNKKPVQIFYPSHKGSFCLKWASANGLLNYTLMILGFVCVIVLIIREP